MGFVFGGEVLRFYHGGDECLTVPPHWSDSPEQNTVVYEGGPVFNQARSLWRLDLVRTKWYLFLIKINLIINTKIDFEIDVKMKVRGFHQLGVPSKNSSYHDRTISGNQ